MNRMKIHFLATFLCVAMYVITFASADQQNSSSFLSNYAIHKNICHKIGCEPKCRKGKNNVILKFLNFELFSFKLQVNLRKYLTPKVFIFH